MKKLLALLLVLGLATAANAAIVLSYNGDTSIDEATLTVCTTAVIDVYSDATNSYECFVGNDDGVGFEWTGSNVIYPAAGGDASIVAYSSSWWDATAMSFKPDQPVQAGRHFDFELHCTALGDVTIQLQDAAGTVVDTLLIHQIPEPASMLLLGLGGLLLRRRK